MGTVGVGLGLQCIRVVVLKVTAVARSTGRNIVAIIKHPTSQVSRLIRLVRSSNSARPARDPTALDRPTGMRR